MLGIAQKMEDCTSVASGEYIRYSVLNGMEKAKRGRVFGIAFPGEIAQISKEKSQYKAREKFYKIEKIYEKERETRTLC